ncbi:AEC family transporter [Micromonospora fluostatini]|uniref:AEC family transporter n=1 Tax=Micromonospora sp. JCM 30529 TaxID=3421643 RepID=UPI003D1643BD
MLAAFVPIWLLTGIGWLAGRYRLLGADADRVLGGFVFHLAMPAALFTALSRNPLTFDARALGAFAVSTVVTMGLGFALTGPVLRRFGRASRRDRRGWWGRGWWGRRAPWSRGPGGRRDGQDAAGPAEVARPGVGEATIAAMAAGYVNAANLGIPVVLQVLGSAAFLTEVLLFQVLVVTPVILILLDLGAGRRLRPGRLLSLPLRNPVIAGLTLGAACSGFGWRVPALVAEPLALLGAAAVPAALVTLGLSLNTRGERPAGEGAQVAVFSGLKLVVQPALAWLIGTLAGLGPAALLALVVCAALPTAQNTYIYAREYGQAGSLARRSVIASTALSMVTLAAIAWWLG